MSDANGIGFSDQHETVELNEGRVATERDNSGPSQNDATAGDDQGMSVDFMTNVSGLEELMRFEGHGAVYSDPYGSQRMSEFVEEVVVGMGAWIDADEANNLLVNNHDMNEDI